MRDPRSQERFQRWLLLLGPALLLLGMLPHPATVSPDAIEMAAAGRCIWQASFVEQACAGLEPWFWPPAFPILSGLLVLLGADLAVAVSAVSLLCWSLLVVPLALLARAASVRGRPWAAALVAPVLLAIPAVPLQAMMGDARSLALLGTFSAAALAIQRPLSARRAVAVGVLLGISCLARPEALLPTAGLLLYCTLTMRSLLPGISAAAVLVPYVGLLSAQVGRLTLTSRSWQKGVYSWLVFLPDEWVKHELAAGAYGSSIRAVISTTTLSSPPPPSLDTGRIADWLQIVFLESLPLWLCLLAVIGGVMVCRRRGRFHQALVVLSLVSLPCLVMMVMPQAQDHLLPLNNLQPLLVGLVVLAAIALGGGLNALAIRWPASGGLPGAALVVGLVVAGLRPQPADFAPPLAFDAATRWLESDTPPDTTITASLVSAMIPLRASRRRYRLPAPWGIPAWLRSDPPPDLLVISSLDLPGSLRSVHTMAEQGVLAPVVEFSDDDGWVVVFQLSTPTVPASHPR